MRRAGRLVSDLDDLSRLYAGSPDLHLRPVDLDELLTAVMDALGPGRTLRCILPEQLPHVIAYAAVRARVPTTLTAEAQRHSVPDRRARWTVSRSMRCASCRRAVAPYSRVPRWIGLLRRDLIRVEAAELHWLYAEHRISDTTRRGLQRTLDLEEARLDLARC
ncbi:hypothetical protein ABZZ20_00820 [Streptomyces sp. NPDC006430]|uniref:hypothetical protein n=1 Tax=Streptomyces sp. NPDC006430 TaxID=3154299 RepID=UPI0033A5745B